MATPERVLRAIKARDGHMCAWHGSSCGTDVLVPQHRMGGMGGSKTKHRLSNVIWLCSSINGDIESDAALADEARRRGIKVSFWENTLTKPVRYSDGLFYLDDDGGRSQIDDTPF